MFVPNYNFEFHQKTGFPGTQKCNFSDFLTFKYSAHLHWMHTFPGDNFTSYSYVGANNPTKTNFDFLESKFGV